MKVSEKVKGYLGEKSKWNVLATTDKAGKTNVAFFGSIELVSDDSMIVMLGDNRSYSNLKQNPNAACLVILNNGKTGVATEGCRLYLKVRSMEDEGKNLEECKAKLKARIGASADRLKHYICFDIIETRPILDFGQGI